MSDCAVKSQYGNNGNCVENCLHPYVGNAAMECIYEYECVTGSEHYVDSQSGVRVCSTCGSLFPSCEKCENVEISSNVYEMQCLVCGSSLYL